MLFNFFSIPRNAATLFILLQAASPITAISHDDAVIQRDHNHPLREADGWAGLVGDTQEYISNFVEISGTEKVVKRQQAPPSNPLKNNVPSFGTIKFGETQYWSFSAQELASAPIQGSPVLPSIPEKRDLSKDESQGGESSGLELKKRQNKDKQVFVSVDVCNQPTPLDPGFGSPPPQLGLHILHSAQDTNSLNQGFKAFEGGHVDYADLESGETLYSVEAPSGSASFNGTYTYQITASIDAHFSTWQQNQSLFYVDSDDKTAFFVTTNLTNETSSQADQDAWENSNSPFSIFLYNNTNTQIAGVQRSWCGMASYAQISGNVKSNPNNSTEVGITTVGVGFHKQKFYVQSLTRSTTYTAVMGLNTTGSSLVPNAATMYAAITFQTKTDGNCQLIHNLSFCDTVAYAVPSNPNLWPSMRDLATAYDTNASATYQNFNYSLQQIPCNTTSSAQYSLAANCDLCDQAYRQWLCAVFIPRCQDYSSTASYLQPRNVNSSFFNGTDPSANPFTQNDPTFSPLNRTAAQYATSRNPWIDTFVNPGPYKEVLPCQGLCYHLVQSCPASLGFACPLEGLGRNASYGYVGSDGILGVTCNIPGAFYGVSGAMRSVPSLGPLLFVSLMAAAVLG
jgi:calcium channel MID1